MGSSKPVQANKEQIERAQTMWASFTTISKWSIYVTVAIVILLGIVFIDWS